MYAGSTLDAADAASAVEMFEQGYTAKGVSLARDLSYGPVQMLYERWQLRGAGALMTRERRQYCFDTKLEIVERYVGGATALALAREYDLPSPNTVSNWARMYRRDGEDGLRPKPRGRRPIDPQGRCPAGEVEQLRAENERLRAEVAYLGKLRALTSQQRG
ncbi:MAG: transposase [Mycobacterium sp.]|nr:transposase [Mycobacterium sp.]